MNYKIILNKKEGTLKLKKVQKNIQLKQVGRRGPKGEDGTPGAVGPVGPQGPQGNPGQDGATGEQGPKGDAGIQGPAGPAGANGQGVPTGGAIDQVLAKINSTDYNTEWLTIDKAFVGLPNVDNTSDADKPVSTATQAALDIKINSADAIAMALALG